LTTSSDSYETSFWDEITSQPNFVTPMSWTIRMGDTIAIQVPGKGHCFTKIPRYNQTNQYYPFRVPWWSGEVVSIHRTLNQLEDADAVRRVDEHMNSLSNLPHRFHGEYILEIRWFYTPRDIPGGALAPNTNQDMRQELLETDEIDDIPATSFLFPITVSESHGTSESTYPFLQFYSIRGWSIHRKTLMPTGRTENRHDRGLMYSKYLGRGSVARSQWDGVQTPASESIHESQDRRTLSTQQFHEAITKLSLTDASADVQAHGQHMIGREKEQEQIATFLTSAIKSANDPDSTDSSPSFSLFIAGAPGTGKTASAKCVIARLQKEQAHGLLPPFRFVSINGMEMRHAFEAYVRLWELTTSNKDKRSPGEAAARLEAYFGCSHTRSTVDDGNEGLIDVDSKSSHSQTKNRLAIVCLVDEIDYLVTNKQTVVYNLFDWPIRGFIAKSEAQLIVLGISNTLNLPERLHPRISSRLGRERCIFRAYNVDESVNILKSRLAGLVRGYKLSSFLCFSYFDSSLFSSFVSCRLPLQNIFQSDAITFAARKTAAESGDIRKAFSLCKVAAEMVLGDIEMGKRNNTSLQITIVDIQKASREMFGTLLYKAVTNATALEALLLVSLASLKKQSCTMNDSGFHVNDILVKMDGVSRAFGHETYLPSPTLSELLGMLSRLGEVRIYILLLIHRLRL
jgi:origin recognition complex subunit 1